MISGEALRYAIRAGFGIYDSDIASGNHVRDGKGWRLE